MLFHLPIDSVESNLVCRLTEIHAVTWRPHCIYGPNCLIPVRWKLPQGCSHYILKLWYGPGAGTCQEDVFKEAKATASFIL